MLKGKLQKKPLNFVQSTLKKLNLLGFPESRHDDRVGGKGSRGLHVITPSVKDLLQAHLYMLNNSNEVVIHTST